MIRADEAVRPVQRSKKMVGTASRPISVAGLVQTAGES